MATFANRNGKIRASVCVNGVRKSASFQTRSEANYWAAVQERGVHLAKAQIEQQMLDGRYAPNDFSEILIKYRDEVSIHHKAADREQNMIETLLKADFMSVPIAHLTGEHFTKYRDMRLKTVKPSTISRHFDILRQAARIADTVWKWVSPVQQLEACKTVVPQPSAFRRISKHDIEALRTEANRARVWYLRPCIELALTTAMRRGELAKLDWADIDLDRSLLTVRDTKNGFDRTIPLSPPARAVLEHLRANNPNASGSVFGTTEKAITESWKRCKRRAGVNVRFHDLRHEACSQLFELGLSPVEVASISGHRTMSQLMRYSHAAQDRLLQRLNEVLS